MDALTAAHPTLPMPSYVRVTNQLNQRSIVVRVNDRGPFRGGRVIDVSVKAAAAPGISQQRACSGARRICRPSGRRGVGRPHPGGDAADRRARAGARNRAAGSGTALRHQSRLRPYRAGPGHSRTPGDCRCSKAQGYPRGAAGNRRSGPIRPPRAAMPAPLVGLRACATGGVIFERARSLLSL